MTKEEIIEALKEVKDPEIPPISIVDLGIVTDIQIDNKDVHVILTPTFSGCPALKIMEEMVEEKLTSLEVFDKIEVETTFDTPWNTDRITEEGRKALLRHGLAPPKRLKETGTFVELDVLSETACPYCGSHDTTFKSPFGPTLCRSLHYCNNCLQAFEGFKPVD